MTGEKKAEAKKPKAYQMGLAVCVIVIVILGGMFYSTYQSQLNQTDSLKSQVNSLTTDKNSLTTERNSLQSQIVDLKNQVNSLTTKVNDLQSKYNVLNDTVNLKKSTVLDKDKTLNIQARGHQTLSYSTAYAGYIRVDFAASGSVYFWVGSELAGGWYAPYTSYGTTTSGRLTVPVFPGTTNLDIRNADLLTGVTVTFTVTYIY